MVRRIDLNRNLGVAVILGVFALTFNYLASTIASTGFYISIGNIFLFLSAGAFGLQGAMVSFAFGIVPEALANGRHAELLRLLVLCSALGYAARRHPLLPGFAIALMLWMVVFGPLLLFARSVQIADLSLRPEYLFFTGLSEVLFVMVSGALLINSRVWTTLTATPRHLPPSSMLVHVIASISTLAMCGALSATFTAISASPEQVAQRFDFAGLFLVLALGIAAPCFLAWRLSLMISGNFQELFSNGFLSGTTNKSFSGLSSEFWRRQSKAPAGLSKGELATLNESATPTVPKGSLISPEKGLCALNRNGTITFVNRRFRRFCAMKSNDVLGKHLARTDMNPEMCKRMLQLLEETFTKGPRKTEVRVNELPEKLRFFEIQSHRSDSFEESSLLDGPDSVIITVIDITERRTVESHLLQSQKLESLGALVKGVAHTFNNALTTIAGQASVAKRSKSEGEIARCLNEVLKTTFHAGSVVRQLLDFANGEPSHMRPHQLGTVLEERLELLRRITGDGCEITFVRSDVDAHVVCDVNLVIQALTNLILNSKESYADKSGRIDITLGIEQIDEEASELNPGTRPGEFARLRVKDYGQGMTPEVLAKAFDPLFTTKAASGHTGLGLSILFAIVRAQDGFLTAESYPDKGTTISIYLPLATTNAKHIEGTVDTEARSATEESAHELMGNRERILVVEDEEMLRELIQTMLSSLGYEVSACEDGKAALDRATTDRFDLILIDAVIPKIRGLDLIARLAGSGVGSKCLLMTGYGPALQVPAHNAAQVIHKPFDLDTLGRAVKRMLESGGTVVHESSVT